MKQISHKASLFLASTLMLLSLGYFIHQPIFNSHYFRQAQTLQGASQFLAEGWKPLEPKLWYYGKPGYAFLEFPLYQSLIYAGVKASGWDEVFVAKLISVLAAFFLCWAFLNVLSLGPFRGSKRSRLSLAVLLASSPIFYAVAQWTSLEMLNACLASWALFFFLKFLEAPSPWGSAIGLFFCSTATLAMKPNALFAVFPIFVFGFFSRGSVQRKVGASLISVASAIAPAAWLIYAEKMNLFYGNHFRAGTGGSLYITINSYLNFHEWAVIVGRIPVYLIGPGTVLLLVVGLLSQKKTAWSRYRPWLAGAAVCGVAYFLAFERMNFCHNYYQLPLVMIVYVAIACLLEDRTIPTWALLLAVCLNGAVAYGRLLKQDPGWIQAIPELQQVFPPGLERPEIHVSSDEDGAPPLLSYYLRRFTRADSRAGEKDSEWMITCHEPATRDWCVDQAVKRVPSCKSQGKAYPGLWICHSQ